MKNRLSLLSLCLFLVLAQTTQVNAGLWQNFSFMCRTQATSALFTIKQNPLVAAAVGLSATALGLFVYNWRKPAAESSSSSEGGSTSSASDSGCSDAVAVAGASVMADDKECDGRDAQSTGGAGASVHWATESQLEQVRYFDADFEVKMAQLKEFVDKQVDAVIAAIQRRSDASAAASAAATVEDSSIDLAGSAFEAVGGFDFMEAMSTLEGMIGALQIPDQPEIKDGALRAVDEQIVKLEEVNSSLAHVQSLIADEGVSLFDRIADNNDIRKVNIQMVQLYQFIGLDPVNRAAKTAADLIMHYDTVFIPSCGDDEAGRDKKMKARQVRFILGNEMGKRIYDAWLSDFMLVKTEREKLGQLAMMRISTQEAGEFGIGLESIAQKSSSLIACITNLKQLRAQLV